MRNKKHTPFVELSGEGRPVWLVRSRVLKVEDTKSPYVSMQCIITHVYAGPTVLQGQTWMMWHIRQSVTPSLPPPPYPPLLTKGQEILAGVKWGFRRAIYAPRTDNFISILEETGPFAGLNAIAKNYDDMGGSLADYGYNLAGVTPLVVLDTSRKANMALAHAAAVEKAYSASPKMLLEYARQNREYTSVWAISEISNWSNFEARAFLLGLAQNLKQPPLKLIALDRALQWVDYKTSSDAWKKSSLRLALRYRVCTMPLKPEKSLEDIKMVLDYISTELKAEPHLEVAPARFNKQVSRLIWVMLRNPEIPLSEKKGICRWPEYHFIRDAMSPTTDFDFWMSLLKDSKQGLLANEVARAIRDSYFRQLKPEQRQQIETVLPQLEARRQNPKSPYEQKELELALSQLKLLLWPRAPDVTQSGNPFGQILSSPTPFTPP